MIPYAVVLIGIIITVAFNLRLIYGHREAKDKVDEEVIYTAEERAIRRARLDAIEEVERLDALARGELPDPPKVKHSVTDPLNLRKMRDFQRLRATFGDSGAFYAVKGEWDRAEQYRIESSYDDVCEFGGGRTRVWHTSGYIGPEEVPEFRRTSPVIPKEVMRFNEVKNVFERYLNGKLVETSRGIDYATGQTQS